jgi:hypothetical protein
MFNIHPKEANMKRLLCSLMLVAAAGAAMADDLGDADKALRAREYGRAFPLYARLADAGNAEAQFRLGEMYWYGDGTAVDMSKSRAWLQKAASSGHAGARETLAVLAQRERRAADIAYWTKGYQGEDLVSGKYACPMPSIPAASTKIDEIKTVAKDMSQWTACYNDFAAAVNATGRPLNRIPADIVKLMTPAEIAQAANHIDATVAAVIQRREAEAQAFASRRDSWLAETGKAIDEGRAEVLKARLDYEYGMIRRVNDNYLAQRPGPASPSGLGTAAVKPGK